MWVKLINKCRIKSADKYWMGMLTRTELKYLEASFLINSSTLTKFEVDNKIYLMIKFEFEWAGRDFSE